MENQEKKWGLKFVKNNRSFFVDSSGKEVKQGSPRYQRFPTEAQAMSMADELNKRARNGHYFAVRVSDEPEYFKPKTIGQLIKEQMEHR